MRFCRCRPIHFTQARFPLRCAGHSFRSILPYEKLIVLHAMRKTAKLFKNGQSQAVRLPKEFRFDGKEVLVERDGERVILSPLVNGMAAFYGHYKPLPGSLREKLA